MLACMQKHVLHADLSHCCTGWLNAVSQTEKELQNGGEIKELTDVADKLSKRLVKDTTAWSNKKESLAADSAACQQASCFSPMSLCHKTSLQVDQCLSGVEPSHVW